MKKNVFLGAVVVGSALFMMAAGGDKAAKPAANAEQIKRGGYLVMVGGCNDCHTPFKMTGLGPIADMDRMLSGHPEGAPDPAGTLVGPADSALAGGGGLTAWKQPFGIVYARNLTPDKTGLGDWTEDQFIKTMRTGRHQGDGRALLTPMPWFNYMGMTDDDLKAVFAYLKSIKAIKNKVPDPKVPPPVLDQFAKYNAAVIEMITKGTPMPPAPPPAPAAPAKK